MVARIIEAAPALEVGQFAVVAQGLDTLEWWNTGRSYATAPSAFARQSREFNMMSCNAYVVKRHSAGTTVYLSPGTTLGTQASTSR